MVIVCWEWDVYPTNSNSKLELENDLFTKSIYYNVNPQFKVYTKGKKHWNVSLYIHIFEHSYFFHVCRRCYDVYTSLPKGHHKNQGLNITIFMLCS